MDVSKNRRNNPSASQTYGIFGWCTNRWPVQRVFYQQSKPHLCCMIQRIQTVYLLLAAVAGVFMFIVPVLTVAPEVHQEGSLTVYQISGLQVNQINQNESTLYLRPWAVLITNALVLLMSVFLVFLYKNRPLQLRLCRLLFLLVVVQMVLLVLGADKIKEIAGDNYAMSFPVGAILPVLELVFVKLAANAIRSDERLVRSADRLR